MWTERYSTSEKGYDAFKRSRGSLHPTLSDFNRHGGDSYVTFLIDNGLMTDISNDDLPLSSDHHVSIKSLLLPISSSLFVNYFGFKIEEIQKGTCVNRLKKRIQLEIGPHTLTNYVSVFSLLYDAFITNVKNANKIITDYESMKQSALKKQQQHVLPNGLNVNNNTKRGRKRKSTEDIISQY